MTTTHRDRGRFVTHEQAKVISADMGIEEAVRTVVADFRANPAQRTPLVVWRWTQSGTASVTVNTDSAREAAIRRAVVTCEHVRATAGLLLGES